MRITAADELAARARMVQHFGIRWAHQYPAAGATWLDELDELPESEWPPPLAVEVEAHPNHTILGCRELCARCQFNPLEALFGDERYMLRAVLVSGSLGDVAVYVGIGSKEWVADHGVKAPFDIARGFFPKLQERLYRL